MYLLDTNTVVYSLKGSSAVEENLQHHFNDPMSISVITLMELYYGAYKSHRVTGNLAKLRTLENALEVIPPGKESADIFGSLKARLEKSDSRLDDFDLVIAATALAHNLILVTNNVKHFQRIEGLELTNWMAYAPSV